MGCRDGLPIEKTPDRQLHCNTLFHGLLGVNYERVSVDCTNGDGRFAIAIFRDKKKMGEWLRVGDGTFEDEINRIVRLHGWAASELLRVEAMRFRNGVPVSVEHIMGFEHVE